MNRPPVPLDRRLAAALAAAKLLIHLLAINRYGYFRDELYFLDCARHLDWGYVDHAPLVALYARVALLLGGSLPALRILPALAGAGVVALTMLIAGRLGGGRFAQTLAGLCVLASPVYLAMDGLLSMNAFEPLFWIGCVYLVIRVAQTGDRRLWVWFGVLAGLGLENKHSMLLFGFAIAAALLLSPERGELRKPWIWIGGAIAGVIFLPNLIWEARHGFATLEDLENVQRTGKNVVLGPVQFVAQQIVIVHPILFPVWLSGLVSLLAGKARRLRVLGLAYLVLLVTMFVLKAKHYYLAPIYPILFAAGAVAIEDCLGRRGFAAGRVWLKTAVVTLVVLAGAIIAPMTVPILPPDRLVSYGRALGFVPPKIEVHHDGPLEQHFGDQFGWEELVADVANVYGSLPAEERARTGIFASNYGEAGALNLFGPAYGLPPAICAHQTHYFWGPGDFRGDSLIWLQWDREGIEPFCTSVEEAGGHFHPWGMAEENRPIYLCRGLRAPLAEIWPRLKHWN